MRQYRHKETVIECFLDFKMYMLKNHVLKCDLHFSEGK
jgi:hypothetical protein